MANRLTLCILLGPYCNPMIFVSNGFDTLLYVSFDKEVYFKKLITILGSLKTPLEWWGYIRAKTECVVSDPLHCMLSPPPLLSMSNHDTFSYLDVKNHRL